MKGLIGWLSQGVRDLAAEAAGIVIGILALAVGGYVWVTWDSGTAALIAAIAVVVICAVAVSGIGRILNKPNRKAR